jgi:glutaredoxin 3
MPTPSSSSHDPSPADQQPNVVIYTRPFCGFCSRAISLLRQKGVAFTEIEAGFDPALRREMIDRSGRTTFPQIFVGKIHIGGCDELMALDGAGKFDAMLRA